MYCEYFLPVLPFVIVLGSDVMKVLTYTAPNFSPLTRKPTSNYPYTRYHCENSGTCDGVEELPWTTEIEKDHVRNVSRDSSQRLCPCAELNQWPCMARELVDNNRWFGGIESCASHGNCSMAPPRLGSELKDLLKVKDSLLPHPTGKPNKNMKLSGPTYSYAYNGTQAENPANGTAYLQSWADCLFWLGAWRTALL